MRNVVYHAVLIVVVFLGILLGTLPDLFPGVLSLLPYFRELDAGLVALSEFHSVETENTFLNRGDTAYLRPLHSFHRGCLENINVMLC